MGLIKLAHSIPTALLYGIGKGTLEFAYANNNYFDMGEACVYLFKCSTYQWIFINECAMRCVCIELYFEKLPAAQRNIYK